MRKVVGFLTLLFCVLIAANAFARAQFIIDSKSHTQRDTSNSSTHSSTFRTCPSMGYTQTSCPAGEHGVESCPINSQYFKYCCPQEAIYTASQCRTMMRKPTGGCHGYYKCE